VKAQSRRSLFFAAGRGYPELALRIQRLASAPNCP
jgi:hypothetical protein